MGYVVKDAGYEPERDEPVAILLDEEVQAPETIKIPNPGEEAQPEAQPEVVEEDSYSSRA